MKRWIVFFSIVVISASAIGAGCKKMDVVADPTDEQAAGIGETLELDANQPEIEKEPEPAQEPAKDAE